MMTRNALLTFFFGGGLFLFGQSMLQSCGPQDTRTAAEKGAELYHSYCEICHGTRGDGPMEEVLKMEVPDLTIIAQNNGGTFPEERIFDIIRGNEEILSHGTSDMPVWGEVFLEGENLRRQRQVDARVEDLVAYIEAIQR